MLPYVPFMVHLPKADGDLRRQLNLPPGAIVFGRHGGDYSFDIPFAQEAVVQCARARRDLYFLFMNTNRFCEEMPNIKHIGGTADPLQKARFIATCDAMIHARHRGETFGLAVAEFSIMNKPVFTWGGSVERCHLEILGNKAIWYRDKEDLIQLLLQFHPATGVDYDAYSGKYSPSRVMARFDSVFLK